MPSFPTFCSPSFPTFLCLLFPLPPALPAYLPPSFPPFLLYQTLSLFLYVPLLLPSSPYLPLSLPTCLSYLTSLLLFLPSSFTKRPPSFPASVSCCLPPPTFRSPSLPSYLILPPSYSSCLLTLLNLMLLSTSRSFSLCNVSLAVCEDYNHFRKLTSASEVIRTFSESTTVVTENDRLSIQLMVRNC